MLSLIFFIVMLSAIMLIVVMQNAFAFLRQRQ
jgi:hypothetical protein